VDTNQHRLLQWQPAAQAVAYITPEALPNRDQITDLTLTRQGDELVLSLPSDHKVNTLSPSYLAIFDPGAPGQAPAAAFEAAALNHGTLKLPTELSKEAVIQGSLYLCPHDDPEQCELTSVHAPVQKLPKARK